jgi:hypothetical protein
MKNRLGEMDDLDTNLDVLHKFKDTKTLREEKLMRETKRYEKLKRELETLKRNGKVE